MIEASGPAGAFVLDEGERPLALVSAGIGVTPLLAMLGELARSGSTREVWWIHGARCGAEHSFREEARGLVGSLKRGRMHVRYSRPEPGDHGAGHHDSTGRLTAEAVLALGVPTQSEFLLCGTPAFVDGVTAGLAESGVPAERMRSESFGGPAPNAEVSFSRAGVTAKWDERYPSLLELAEANHVPAASGCRIGACHGCKATVLAGAVRHDPEPVTPPPAGTALLCCARPEGDVVLDT